MMEDTLNLNVQALVLQAQDSAIENWSDARRKEFTNVFKQRATAAKYIYFKTADLIIQRAQSKKIISTKHSAKFNETHHWNIRHLFDHDSSCNRQSYCSCGNGTVGGRVLQELDTLATQRAENILQELPSVRKALSIIQPAIGLKMDRRDVLMKEGQDLTDELDELSKPIRLRDLDPNTKIGEVLEQAEILEGKRDVIAQKLVKIGREGSRLEDEINTALFEGIPELSEAVLKVAHDHHERGIFFDQATRRVEEKVMFGDSKAAMDILQRFEKDEVDVSSTIKAEFSGALERLQLRGGKKRTKKGE